MSVTAPLTSQMVAKSTPERHARRDWASPVAAERSWSGCMNVDSPSSIGSKKNNGSTSVARYKEPPANSTAHTQPTPAFKLVHCITTSIVWRQIDSEPGSLLLVSRTRTRTRTLHDRVIHQPARRCRWCNLLQFQQAGTAQHVPTQHLLCAVLSGPW